MPNHNHPSLSLSMSLLGSQTIWETRSSRVIGNHFSTCLSISQYIFVKSLSLSRKATLREHFWAVIKKFMISSLCAPWCFEGLLPETTRAYFGPQPIHPSGTLSIVHGRHKTPLGLAALQCSVRILTNSGSHSLTPGPGPAINPKPPHPCPAERVGQVTHVALDR